MPPLASVGQMHCDPTRKVYASSSTGGSWAGQYSGPLMVPDRGFVITVLTNSDGGPNLIRDLFTDDWALRRFAGVRNLPARPRPLAEGELAAYQGRYSVETIDVNGNYLGDGFDVAAADGQLVVTAEGATQLRLAFYRHDHVLVLNPDGTATGTRADFVRDAHGEVAWLRMRGRLHRRG